MNDVIAMGEYNSLQNNPSSAKIREELNAYVISRGARDCSILISFREVPKGTTPQCSSCFTVELIS